MEKIEGYIFTGKDYEPFFDYWESLRTGSLQFDFKQAKHADSNSELNEYSFELENESVEVISKLVGDSDSGMFLVLSSVVSLLLHKYSKENRIIIDSPLYETPGEKKKYATQVPLTFDIDPKKGLTDLVSHCQERIKQTYRYQNFPLELLKGNQSRELFRTNIAVKYNRLHSNELDRSYDLIFEFNNAGEHNKVVVKHSKKFEYNFIVNLANHFNRLVAGFKDLKTKIEDISLIDQKEVEFLTTGIFSNEDLPASPTFKNLFERQVSLIPEALAVKCQEKELTYQELNNQANQLAHFILDQYKVTNGDIIGVVVGRTDRMIVAFLAILKCGAAYLPIDSSFPKARKSLILEDAQAKLLLTETDYMFDFDQFGGEMVMLDVQTADLETSLTNTTVDVKGDDLAYVIYTSGSTGKPKGVLVENRGAINMCLRQIETFGMYAEDKVMQLASCSFDASVSEIFTTLLCGAQLVMVEQSILKEPEKLFEFLQVNEISVVTFPPSFLTSIDVSRLSQLRVVISAGEEANIETALECSKYVDFYNAYGPTECSVCVTILHLNSYLKSRDNQNVYAIPIGKPIANLKVYLLDDQNDLVPYGLPGEVCVSGTGVAKGYIDHDNQGINELKFISNPFESGTIYKTGDMARWLPDGDLQFLGRKDSQVKIRGYRVELGEIQKVIESKVNVDSCYVATYDVGESDKVLVAYYTGQESNASEITDKIGDYLPSYMIPAYFVHIDKFPLNKQGKIDKTKLPNPLLDTVGSNYLAPSNDEEKRLVEIWQNILGHSKIGIASDFFLLGGDSIKAIRLVGEINDQLSVNIEVKDIFNHPNVEQLLQYIKSSSLESEPGDLQQAVETVRSIKDKILEDPSQQKHLPEDWEDVYPASDIQVGMLYHNLLDADKGVFHDQMYHQIIDKSFDYNVFRKAVECLVSKHEILRTSFDFRNFASSVQILHKPNSEQIDIELHDITYLNKQQQKEHLETYLRDDIKNQFDISKPGLFRVRVFQLSDENIGVLLVFHHAIIDGWSDNSFSAELSNVYQSLKEDDTFKPKKLRANYKDYVVDQIRQKESEKVRQFWKEELAVYDGVHLPLDKKVSDKGVKRGSTINKTFFLDSTISKNLIEYANSKSIPLKHLLFSAFLLLLKKTTNKENVCVGLVSNGRPDKADGDKILGCFLNTVPFIYDFKSNISLGKYVDQVNQKCICYKSFDKLSLPEIMKIGGRDSTYNPMIDVSFNYVDFHITQEVSAEVQEASPLVTGSGNNPVPFAFSIKKVNDNIRVNSVFFEGLYNENEIVQIGKYFQLILSQIPAADTLKLSEVSVMDDVTKSDYLSKLEGEKVNWKTETIVSKFAKLVEEQPDSTAVLFRNNKLTYKQLNEKSNRLAKYIRSNFDVRREDRIALWLDRTENYLIAILGTLKSGCCVVPLTKDMPHDRVKSILDDASISAVISDSSFPIEEYKGKLIDVNKDLSSYGDKDLTVINSDSDLAYIIYTSGTTGMPKGVMVEHANILNSIKDQVQEFNITEEDNIIQLAAATFDVAMYEIFMGLLSGASVIMVDKETIGDPKNFVSYLKGHEATVMAVTPGYLSLLNVDDLEFLRVIITGGESPKMTDVLKCTDFSDYYNSFGPSECSVCVSTHKFDQEADRNKKSLPIGKPLTNTRISIVDRDGQLVPPGVTGEMYVEGAGVARGYLNNPELTAEKFIVNSSNKRYRTYKTGDLSRCGSDGFIEFLGRNDKQLKVNGYRIEPGEIEAVLIQHPDVQNAFVTIRRQEGLDNILVAYLACKGEIEGLRAYLVNKLPGYMVPGFIALLDKLPLTENGKIDEQKLKEYDLRPLLSSGPYAAPKTKLEKEIATIWMEVLGVNQVSINDNFFETGGNSLTLIRVFNKLSVKHKDLRVVDLFTYPTISSIAEQLEGDEEKNKVLAEGFNV